MRLLHRLRRAARVLTPANLSVDITPSLIFAIFLSIFTVHFKTTPVFRRRHYT
jgi:hypothetical protein